MTFSVAASHAVGKMAEDKIFAASGAAQKAVLEHGKDKVINATTGAILDENEKLVCLSVVEKAWRSLPMTEVINYAPIAGLPEYLSAAIDLTFADNKPDAYIKAVATAGGAGTIHHTIWNYSEIGDTLLVADWYWNAYETFCADALRKLDTYTFFNEEQKFNLPSLEAKVKELLQKQKSLVVILNTPAHNPTGYSLTDDEWENVLGFFKEMAADEAKKIILFVDIAYIDYAGEKNASRSFMKKFTNLPPNLLLILGFSMSKGHTMYGQRVGAMIGVSSNQDVITEFAGINQYTSRATWSNINRGAMRLLTTIYQDEALQAELEAERNGYYQLIQERAAIFVQEAKAIDLQILPYVAGFFITLPAADPDAVCAKLHEDLIYAVPLGKGVRIAVCAVPKRKITGMAAKVAAAMQAASK